MKGIYQTLVPLESTGILVLGKGEGLQGNNGWTQL